MVNKKYFLYLGLTFFTVSELFASSDNIEKLSLQLDWKHQFEYAGYYMAKEKGFYNKAGLNVEIKEFNGKDPVSVTLSGDATFGTYNSKIVLSKMKGEPIVFLANIFKKSGLVLISQKDIRTPKDFVNKKIMATADQFQTDGIGALIKRFGVEKKYQQIEPTFNISDFVNNKVDAFSAYISNEPFELNKNNVSFNIIDPANYGIYMYGDSLFTTISEVEKNPERVSNFISASIEGWEYALNNIDETIKIIKNKYNTQNKSIEALKYEAEETKRLIMPDVYKLGSIDKDKIKNISDTFVELGLAEKNNYSFKNFIFEDLKNSAIKLNYEEQNYINNQKILTICSVKNLMPYESIDKNNLHGINADYLKLVSNLLDIKFEIKSYENSNLTLRAVQNGECDLTSIYNQNLETSFNNIYISEAYYEFPLVAVSKIEKPFLSNIEHIANEKVSVVEGESFSNMLISNYKIDSLIEVQNINSGLKKVNSDEVEYFVNTLPLIGYFLQKDYYSQLKISGKFPENFQLRFATKDPQLKNILNKVIRAIPESESTRIINSWISIKYDDFDKTIFIRIVVFFVIIISVLYLRYVITDRYNRKLTEEVQRQLEEIRKKDSALLSQNKLASMGEMIGSIAHQWKQPLNILQLNIEMLIDDYDDGLIDDKFINEFRDKNIDIIKFMVTTIDDFRNFFRVEKEKSMFDIKSSVTKIVDMQKIYLKKRNIDVEIIGDNFKAYGFSTEFQQVILNLINNAKDEMVKKNMSDGKIKINISKDGLVHVIDNAGGVPEQIINKIFEPYFTTKGVGEGTGLGLHMSKTIVEDHLDGKIGVTNVLGGAEFFVKLTPVIN